jgi:hypothetical protein
LGQAPRVAEEILLHLREAHRPDALLGHHDEIDPPGKRWLVPAKDLADEPLDAVPEHGPTDLLGDGDPETTRSMLNRLRVVKDQEPAGVPLDASLLDEQELGTTPQSVALGEADPGLGGPRIIARGLALCAAITRRRIGDGSDRATTSWRRSPPGGDGPCDDGA